MTCSCHQTHGYCQCILDDTDCIEVQDVDPYELGFVIDPDADNLLSESPAGLKVLLPRERTNPPTTGVQRKEEFKVRVADNVPVPFDTELWDSFGGWTAEQPTQAVAPFPGMYIATGHARFTRQNGGFRSVALVLGGGTNLGVITQWMPSSPTPVSNAIFQTANALFRMDADDFIELWVFQSSVISNLPLELNSNPYTCSLSLHRIGEYS